MYSIIHHTHPHTATRTAAEVETDGHTRIDPDTETHTNKDSVFYMRKMPQHADVHSLAHLKISWYMAMVPSEQPIAT